MTRTVPVLIFLAATLVPQVASATLSAELYTAASYGYGRVAARLRFAAGDGVVGALFLWKDGSEMPGTFWNELDVEKVGADCRLLTNAFYGNPAVVHSQPHPVEWDPCSDFHTYVYEWTPDTIVWSVDEVEIRRETGAGAAAFAENTPEGMQIRFNVWPGDSTFGGNFSPSILPVHQYVDWVEFSSYADGEFTFEWREEFDADSLPAGWLKGSWPSPKNLSTHDPRNVNVIDGYAVLSLTSDEAPGSKGARPEGTGGTTGSAASPGGPSDAGCSIAGSRALDPNAMLGVFGLATLGAFRRRKRSR